MARVIGVRFRDNGKIYYFASEQFEVEVGQNVIVETARGVEYGRVVLGNREIHDEKIIATLKPVIRIATPEDDKIQENNKEKSKEAYKICIEKIKKHKPHVQENALTAGKSHGMLPHVWISHHIRLTHLFPDA